MCLFAFRSPWRHEFRAEGVHSLSQLVCVQKMGVIVPTLYFEEAFRGLRPCMELFAEGVGDDLIVFAVDYQDGNVDLVDPLGRVEALRSKQGDGEDGEEFLSHGHCARE